MEKLKDKSARQVTDQLKQIQDHIDPELRGPLIDQDLSNAFQKEGSDIADHFHKLDTDNVPYALYVWTEVTLRRYNFINSELKLKENHQKMLNKEKKEAH